MYLFTGAGVLEFPYMFSKVGLITAFLLLVFLLICAGMLVDTVWEMY